MTTTFLEKSPADQIALLSSVSEETPTYHKAFCQHFKTHRFSPEWESELTPSVLEQLIPKFSCRTDQPDGLLNFSILIRALSRLCLEQVLCSTGATDSLCSALDNCTNTEVLEHGCKALGMIATNPDIPQAFLERATRTFSSILINHRSNGPIIALTCVGLNNCFFKRPDSKNIFIKRNDYEGGPPNIISIFAAFPKDDLPREKAALLLRNLCNSGSKRKELFSLNEHIVDYLLDSLERTKDNAQCQLNLIWAIINLSKNNTTIKQAFASKGAFDQLVQVLSDSKTNDDIFESLLICLHQLCKRSAVPSIMTHVDYIGYSIPLATEAEVISQVIKTATRLNRKTEDPVQPFLYRMCKFLTLILETPIGRNKITERDLTDLIQLKKDITKPADTMASYIQAILKVFHQMAGGAESSKIKLKIINFQSWADQLSVQWNSCPEIIAAYTKCLEQLHKPGYDVLENISDVYANQPKDFEELVKNPFGDFNAATTSGEGSPELSLKRLSTYKRRFDGGPVEPSLRHSSAPLQRLDSSSFGTQPSIFSSFQTFPSAEQSLITSSLGNDLSSSTIFPAQGGVFGQSNDPFAQLSSSNSSTSSTDPSRDDLTNSLSGSSLGFSIIQRPPTPTLPQPNRTSRYTTRARGAAMDASSFGNQPTMFSTHASASDPLSQPILFQSVKFESDPDPLNQSTIFHAESRIPNSDPLNQSTIFHTDSTIPNSDPLNQSVVDMAFSSRFDTTFDPLNQSTLFHTDSTNSDPLNQSTIFHTDPLNQSTIDNSEYGQTVLEAALLAENTLLTTKNADHLATIAAQEQELKDKTKQLEELSDLKRAFDIEKSKREEQQNQNKTLQERIQQLTTAQAENQDRFNELKKNFFWAMGMVEKLKFYQLHYGKGRQYVEHSVNATEEEIEAIWEQVEKDAVPYWIPRFVDLNERKLNSILDSKTSTSAQAPKKAKK